MNYFNEGGDGCCGGGSFLCAIATAAVVKTQVQLKITLYFSALLTVNLRENLALRYSITHSKRLNSHLLALPFSAIGFTRLIY